MESLADHTTSTVTDHLDDAVALVPTGAVEQHGPALPLGTDLFAARAVAEAVERDVVVAPPVPVGVSDHHRQFHGSLWVRPETFERYVEDVVRSLADHGPRKLVLVNGHGGNDDALERVARRLRRDEAAFAVPWNWWSNLEPLAADLFAGAGIEHAGAVETSMVYAVAEDLVREASLNDAEADASDAWGQSVAGAALPVDAADFSANGAVGRPTDASREAGRRLFERAVADLETLVDWLDDRAFETLLPPAHR